MQNRFPPKYTNHIKPNLGNNFNRNSNASHRSPDSSYFLNANLNPNFNLMFKSNPDYHQNFRGTPKFYANNYTNNLQNNTNSENKNQKQ
jgi:hypothetical protein